MEINKDNVLDASWNNESMLQIRTALQQLLTDLGDSIEAAQGGKPVGIELSLDGNELTASVTLADGETELSASIDLTDVISAGQAAVEIVDNLFPGEGLASKAMSADMGVLLNQKTNVVLEHMHWNNNSPASLSHGQFACYYNPTTKKIHQYYGRRSGQFTNVVDGGEYEPSPNVSYYDRETGTVWLWEDTGESEYDLVLAYHPWRVIGAAQQGSVAPILGINETSKLFFLPSSGELCYLWKVGGVTRSITFEPDSSKVYSYPTSGGSKAMRWGGTQWVDVGIDTSTLQPKLTAGTGIAINNNQISVDAEVVQPATPDGTFTIRIGENTYTVNLNHTHENMAKLVVCEESELPSTLDPATIYAITDSGETEIEKLIIRGIEFVGGAPDTGEPMISSPTSGVTINLDRGNGQFAKTITVKGKNLTGDLTVTVGTGLTLTYGQSTGQSSVTIPMAQALLGAQLTIVCSSNNSISDGSMTISHGGSVLSSVTVAADYAYIRSGLVFHLDGADADTTQWVDRKGGIAFSMNNVTLDGNGGVVFNGTNAYGRYAEADSLGFSANTHTIEVVANIGGTTTATIFMQNATNSLAFGITSIGSLIYTAGLGETLSKEPIQRKTINFQRGLHTMSFADTVGYSDKGALTVQNDGIFVTSGSNLGVLVGARDSENLFFTGTIYQIRIYNRLLSQQEMLANQDIDIERYNI